MLRLGAAMLIFGTVGVFRRWIPFPSATLAFLRGVLGVVTVLLILLCLRKKPDFGAIRKNLLFLLLSGGAIGANWIFLFEAYNRTTVAVATLCYYMAPVFAMLGALFFFREGFTLKKLLCLLAASAGMVCVSGILTGGEGAPDPIGILCGLAAALLYASVILMNRRINEISAYDKTVVQLFAAAVVVLPYALLRESIPAEALAPSSVLLTLVVGVLHTGVAYALYFSAMNCFPVTTVSFFSYLDPVVAFILSLTVLAEPMGVFEIPGILLILGAAVVCELPSSAKSRRNES